MAAPESRLFCRLDGLTPAAREKQRFTALGEFGLLEAEMVPVFEEATQTAARFLEAPICILSLMAQDKQRIKAAVGLSRLGLMNDLATSRQLPRHQSLCAYVVDSHQVLIAGDTLTNRAFAETALVQHYGIRAYLGAPLLSSTGICLGTLAVMDLVPRNFTSKDIDFLELMARWSLSEFERNRLFLETRQLGPVEHRTNSSHWFAKPSPNGQSGLGKEVELDYNAASTNANADEVLSLTRSTPSPSATSSVKVKLLSQLSQELRTPLTSIMGMASVLGREVYGPLTTKQKEYLEIIHNSGQHLVSLVDEILSLGGLDEFSQKLDFTSVDIEMLCQQAINNLQQIASGRQQQIRLSVEPGKRIWLLDKDKVRQILYYLIFNLINSGNAGGVVRIHVSRKIEKLNIAVWVSHPWLGDGLPQIEFYAQSDMSPNHHSEPAFSEASVAYIQEPSSVPSLMSTNQLLLKGSRAGNSAVPEGLSHLSVGNGSRESLGLLLSCLLAEIHGGHISVQGSPEAGYRYVVSLPQVDALETIGDD
ncbi:GAF domain-containing sensor histidine kinase [Coleofasciculus sp. FACHB-1120]|uniref:GAF domain-containing sensor histidine kinase n=1 Tax=Coleofasciculus sp. FACHB-1120 TaxID=2692783 RepID=UPI001687FCEF|nr:GAF domain-containing sensor histidine kinase [Coleofasciculus sp. FACHB-1120]MBD2743422.1 GAF domain-containing sensor histidine kinase [Coleofasciculus sp. FACHB-1120]